MAVTPEQIKARLRANYPKANLSTKRLDAIAAKLITKLEDDADDTAIDAVLSTANDYNAFEDIAREDDRIRTLEANQKKPNDPPQPPTPPNDPPALDETPSWAKALIDSNKKLNEDIEALKSGEVTKTKKQTAAQAIEKSEVFKTLKPEQRVKWLDRISLDSEASIEDQVKEIENEFTDLRQSLVDSTEYSGFPPSAGRSDAKPSEADVAAVVSGII